MSYFTTIFFLFWEVEGGGPSGGTLPVQTDFVCNVARMMNRHGG